MNTETPMPGTALPWGIVWYDAGDKPHYDYNGPCPLINGPESEDQTVVHWDGFKQEYWSSANGDQKRIEANAAYIVWACNNAPALLSALEKAAVRFETVRARIYRLGPNPGMKALELADYTRQCEAEIDAAIASART